MSATTRMERERLLDAMLEEMAEKGCRGVEVEGVMQKAGVAHCDDIGPPDDANAWMYAAYEHLGKRLVERATMHCDSEEAWPERIRAGLETLLEELAARPGVAKVMVRSFPGLRPDAHARYMGVLEAFAPYLAEGRRFSGVAEELPGEVEMLAVGAAEAIIFDEVTAGRAADLPSLMPSILFSVLVPFIGPDKASAAMRSAAERRSNTLRPVPQGGRSHPRPRGLRAPARKGGSTGA
jgi:hypothetical protein